jgi:hypothetical protein
VVYAGGAVLQAMRLRGRYCFNNKKSIYYLKLLKAAGQASNAHIDKYSGN